MSHTFTGRLYTKETNGNPVQFVLAQEGIQVIDNGMILRFENMRVEVGGHEGDRIKMSDTTNGAVLFCSDKRFIDIVGSHSILGQQFKQAHKKLRSAGFNKIAQWVGALMVLAVTAIVILIAVGGLVDLTVAMIDPKLEQRIGLLIVTEAGLQSKGKSFDRVQHIGRRLEKHINKLSPQNPYTFTYYIKDDKTVNASATPGGYLVVNTGLLQQAKSDAEVAGVIGHEIGHVMHRDSLRNLLHELGVGACVGVILAAIGAPDELQKVVPTLQTLEHLQFSRSQEANADIFGTDLAYYSDFDPNAFVDFFQREENKSKGAGSRIIGMLSDHPLDADRVEAIKAEITKLKQESKPTASNFTD